MYPSDTAEQILGRGVLWCIVITEYKQCCRCKHVNDVYVNNCVQKVKVQCTEGILVYLVRLNFGSPP
jgi:hypothetical protein